MSDLLFCPFCREPHEGVARCPEHDLLLVPFFDLPRERSELDDDAPLPWHTASFGRGFVAVGAVACLIAFTLMPVSVVEEPVRMGGSMLALALSGTPKLWLVPCAALTQLLVLHRRRSPRAMRAARVVVPCVALVPLASIAWTYHGVLDAVAVIARNTGQTMEPRLALGAYIIFAATPAMLWGGIRLGVTGPSH